MCGDQYLRHIVPEADFQVDRGRNNDLEWTQLPWSSWVQGIETAHSQAEAITIQVT